ncbi:3-isopropylmalate/(R)-2-methylmalate dehydratase small subunit [Anaerospora hongkongensis]|uniref:3-isopropylmalate dehydratase small subunit n=1 Tax=Anaerospora hongkongensis TaxID=244830 RepID=A0A4R1Q2V1_9FIRM|nr:3-isopropylmalate dehydratase small subunit [Anaerospora hongkongensis]TCL38828.1 3-isopropylmalate/(R)-2-methylmalate dehydratase small subunit [Anaerospora hongkongensis]
MEKVIKGKTFVFGANIDTDQIYPGRFLDLTDPEDVAKHAMEGADPNFVKEFETGDIIVASTNFGCGSSREHAVVTLKSVGIGAILADSFGRIFYRNAINLGIPVIVCPGISELVKKGDVLSVDILSGKVTNETTGATLKAQPFSDYTMHILASGGIKPMIKKQLESQA